MQTRDLAEGLDVASIEDGNVITAPPLLPIDVTNMFRKREGASPHVTLGRAFSLPDDFLTVDVSILSPDRLLRDAHGLAHPFRPPAAYDARDLAPATRLDCTLWTDDLRPLRAVGVRLPFVRLVGEFDRSTM